MQVDTAPESTVTTDGGMGEASSTHAGVLPHDLQGMQDLLQQSTLAQLIARKPPTTVTVLPADWTIERALQLFAAQNLIAAPVVNEDNSNCYGFFDINDALKAVCTWFDVHNVNHHDRMARLRAAGTKLHSTCVRDVIGNNTDGQLLERSNITSSLMQTLVDGFLNPADNGPPCHRIAVFEMQHVGGSMPTTRITHIVTQTDIIRFIAEHLASFPSLANMHVEKLCPHDKSVLCVPSDMPAINALAAAYTNHVSSVGILDITAHGALCGMLSVSDVRGLQAYQLDMLALPVLQFLEEAPAFLRQQQNQMSSAVYGIKGAMHHQDVPWCRPHATLAEVVHTIIAHHYHRVYVVDDADRPVGIVTLSDILEFLTTPVVL